MSVSTFDQTKGSFKELNNLVPFSLLANKYSLIKRNNATGLQNSYLHILKYTDEGLVEVGW
jgi:hypothetical protein